MGCPTECGNTPLLSIFYIFILSGLVLTAIGGAIIFRMSKDETKRTLTNAILLSGLTVGTLFMLSGIMFNGMIFAYDPLPGRSSLSSKFWLTFSFITLGFGLGSIVSTAIGVWGTRLISKISARRKSSEDVGMDEKVDGKGKDTGEVNGLSK